MSVSQASLALERFTTFGDLLKFLRRRVGLTQRELSIAVGYSDAQISRLEQNQRLPDIPTITARFISALDLAHEPQVVSRLLELAATVRREDAPAAGLPPFKGLLYFDEADAELFFGREALVERLASRITGASNGDQVTPQRFLAVVGASGSGKSSLVRAGLVSALRWNPQYAGWPIHVITPTAHPLESLAARLTAEARSPFVTARLAGVLARDADGLHHHVRGLFASAPQAAKSIAIPGEDGPRLLLVVDQFEEVFTLCRAETERRTFIDSLLAAAFAPEGMTTVVIALRADFYAHCAAFPKLREALAGHQEYIGMMSAEELRRAIAEPAQRGNWELEPGLVDLLLKDVGADGARPAEPGALPLLSHALLETWQRRRGRALTLSGYTASSGVRGAIAETAEAVFNDQLDPAQREIARRIFLRLTELGEDEGLTDTRRRVSLEELIRKPEDAEAVREVLTLLADARLITTEKDTAEVAHEALIREWPTLRRWLTENRESLRLHRQLTDAAQEWERLKREEGLVYRGARLAQALGWAAANPAELNRLEREFLDSSQGLAQREAAEREALRERELQAAHRLAEAETRRAEEEARAAALLRRRALYLTGYGKYIGESMHSGRDLIVTVGYLLVLTDPTLAAAEANRELKFFLPDFSLGPPLDNVWAQVYATDQAAFLAGYVAASVTRMGKVGTLGGVPISPVTDFMDGFALGVAYYNAQNGAEVEVLGWDLAARDGLFTGSFDRTDDGRRLGEILLNDGADVIMSVAGEAGLGTAAVVQERGDAYLIGVDSNWAVTYPEYADIMLTSVEKRIDVSVLLAVSALVAGMFTGGTHIGTLETGEVGLSPFPTGEVVSSQVIADLELIRAGVIAGEIQTKP